MQDQLDSHRRPNQEEVDSRLEVVQAQLGNFLVNRIEGGPTSSYEMHLKYKDHLTGLDNKAKFDEDIEKAVVNGVEQPFKLLFVDLEDFGLINKELNQESGDLALKSLGSALKRKLRKNEKVYRIGGDEFAIMIFEEMESDRRINDEPYYHEERRSGVDRRKEHDADKLAERIDNISREATSAFHESDDGAKEGNREIKINYGITEYVEGDTAITIKNRANELAKLDKQNSKDLKKEARLQKMAKADVSFS